ncbi:MAG TPA: tetratricopeptide repeat protein [Chitinophagaceae bacterium]|nr:tetratricopeptide repeat protein [Chitinophagaceae bacterium]
MKYVLLVIYLTQASFSNGQEKYRIKFILDKDSIVSGSQTITWKAPATLDSIAISFGSHFKNAGKISNALINGKKARLEKDPSHKNRYHLLPYSSIPAGSNIVIDLRFVTDTIKDSNGYGFIPVIDDWHPSLPRFRDGIFQWDEQSLKEYDIQGSFAAAYRAALSGPVVTQKVKNDVTTLASRIANVTNFGICLSDKFLVSETTSAGVKIISYYFKHDTSWGRKLLDMSQDIVSFYKSEIGFYPQPIVSILPGWNQPVGGYPISSNMYVIHRNLDLKGDAFGRWIMSHEIGHTYWGFGNVLDVGGYPSWFGLGMGIYTDWLYHKAKNLDLSVYELENRYMAGVLMGVNTTILQPLDSLRKAGFDFNNVISHGKAFTVLQMLEEIVGVENFMQIFKESLKRFQGKTVTLEMFHALSEEVSGLDLDWFFKQWFATNDYLDYRIVHTSLRSEGGKYIQKVRIRRFENAIMPVLLRVEQFDGRNTDIVLNGKFQDTTLTLEMSSPPKSTVLDPEKKLPLLSHAYTNVLTLVTAANYFNSRNDPQSVIWLLEPRKNLGDQSAGFQCALGRAYRRTGQYQKALETFEKGLNLTDRRDYQLLCLLEAGRTYDLMGKRDKAVGYYQKALQESYLRNAATTHLQTPYSER